MKQGERKIALRCTIYTRVSTDAVHSTCVRPNSTSTEPAAISV